MTAELVAVNNELHKNTKIKRNTTYENAKETHLCLLQIHEMVKMSSEYPMVFVKDPDSGEFRAVVMLGLVPNENLYYDTEKWQADYVPSAVRLHPFGLMPSSSDPQQLSLCLNMSSELVNEDEGVSLFNEQGEDSDYLKSVKEFVGTLHNQTPVTVEFVKHLTELNLLSQQQLTVNIGEENKPLTVDGIYTVNTETLEKLDDEAFLELRKRSYLPVIYAHLSSLGQVGKLAVRKAQKEAAAS